MVWVKLLLTSSFDRSSLTKTLNLSPLSPNFLFPCLSLRASFLFITVKLHPKHSPKMLVTWPLILCSMCGFTGCKTHLHDYPLIVLIISIVYYYPILAADQHIYLSSRLPSYRIPLKRLKHPLLRLSIAGTSFFYINIMVSISRQLSVPFSYHHKTLSHNSKSLK